MKPLPFTISISVLFWGWQTGFLPVAICLIPLLEGTFFIKTKWKFSDQDFNNISDFSTIVLAGLLIYYLISDPLKIIIQTIKYLPLIVLPIMLAQLYSTSGKINISSLMLFTGKNKTGEERKNKAIDFSYVYIVTCLISAGMGNNRSNIFYISIICLSLLVLYPLRSKRYPLILWLSMFMISAVLGYFTHTQISRLQEVITEYTINYLAGKSPNPRHQVTSIGDIGTLKLSNRIISRVQKKSKEALYLKLSTYTAYRKSKWFATLAGFSTVKPKKNKTSWVINDKKNGELKQATLYTTIDENRLLELPGGILSLDNLKVEQLEKNTLGSVRAFNGSGFTACKITYNEQKSYTRNLQNHDTEVPPSQKKVIADFLQKLNTQYKIKLKAKTSVEKLRIIKKHFQEQFVYSLTQKGDTISGNPIEKFLFKTKAGHCEFFATTTVMLMRELNIPARYVTGYLVHEYNDSNDMFIVRQRDAHAWCLVYVDGRWRNFDTTPSTWVDYETEKKADTPVKDFISNCRFMVSKWFAERTKEEILQLTAVVTLPFGIFLLFRLRPSRKIKRIKTTSKKSKKEAQAVKQGLYLIEKTLNEKGYKRYKWETFGLWFARIERSGLLKENKTEIHEILISHYNQRYSNIDNRNIDTEVINSKTDAVIEQMKYFE